MGQKFIQLVVTVNKQDLIILRRIEDSYINITQLLAILVKLDLLQPKQIENFLKNEVLSNTQYQGTIKQYNDYRDHENGAIRGLWISYDKAVHLAIKFDIYEITKLLFLIDVHEFDNLPSSNKRLFDDGDDEDDDDDNEGNHNNSNNNKNSNNNNNSNNKNGNNNIKANAQSPTKKPKLETDESISKIIQKLTKLNKNYPYTLPPVELDNQDMITDFKMKFGQVFKDDNDDNKLSNQDIKTIFEPIINKYYDYIDIPLDIKGQTALHFASTLASSNLVSSFIKLGLNSPIRGNIDGESPLISMIQVTNSMEKGNFFEILSNYLYPNLWLYDLKSQSILHHLVLQSNKKSESIKFYTIKIIEFIISNDNYLNNFLKNIINLRDIQGNTCLHLAVENESKWFIKLFLSLKADPNIANKSGIKPIDFDIVKEINNYEFKDHIFDLIETSIEFLNKRVEIDSNIHEVEPIKKIVKLESNKKSTDEDNYENSSSKIFQSIQDLITSTNNEYEMILNKKREQIASLNKALLDSTIVTANNRYILKTISDKLADFDNIKLQMANINDKLQSLKQEIPEIKDEDYSELENFDADEPFIIKPLYDKLINQEPIDDLKTEDLIKSLPEENVLKARIAAYKQVNSNLESELNTLLNYSELTSKFKKIVSICTGVDINEVDEYLDGLLEAVQVQQ